MEAAGQRDEAPTRLGLDDLNGGHSRPEPQSSVTNASVPGKEPPLSKIFPDDSELERLEVDRATEKRRSEINAAVRSLKTNVLLIATLAVVFVLYFRVLNFTNKALMLSMYKSLAPILTAIANFGKIQNVLSSYLVNIKEKLKLASLKIFNS